MASRICFFKVLLVVAFSSLFSCSSNDSDYGKDTSAIQYEESNAIIPNPERGYIYAYTNRSEEEPISAETLSLTKRDNITLVWFMFYLNDYKSRPLDEKILAIIQETLDNVRKNNLKTIVRFAYDDAVGKTDAPLSIVLEHIEQLRPVFEDNEDIIAFVQAGFIGAWGEWHSSTNNLNTLENKRAILFKLLEVLPKSIKVQVRTPSAKQHIFDTEEPITESIAHSDDPIARVGHHNDCFLTGEDEYGTYTYNKIEEEKAYLQQENLYVPMGGETCPPIDYQPICSDSRQQMESLHWTYLNLWWYQPTIALWKESGCYEEFAKNLGYRLVMSSAALPKEMTAGSEAEIELNITNKGYAPVYHQKVSELVLKNTETEEISSIPLSLDIREIKPKDVYVHTEKIKLAKLEPGSYAVFLRISDRAESLKGNYHYSIQLANKDMWVPKNGGLNDLKHNLQIY